MTEHVSTQTSIGQSVVNLTRYHFILNGAGEGLFVNDYNIFSLFFLLSPFIFKISFFLGYSSCMFKCSLWTQGLQSTQKKENESAIGIIRTIIIITAIIRIIIIMYNSTMLLLLLLLKVQRGLYGR